MSSGQSRHLAVSLFELDRRMALEVSPSFLRHWGDILIDGDLLDGFIFLEGFKCHTGFEFGGQMSSFSFPVRGRFSGLMPPHDQPVSSTWSWLRLGGPLQLL
jgi:hypothetical protein